MMFIQPPPCLEILGINPRYRQLEDLPCCL
jgi:hypothetical protein